MEIKTITLLTVEEYRKCQHLIPLIDEWWWLKTPHHNYGDCIRVIHGGRGLGYTNCFDDDGGVRPLCIFNIDPSVPLFWQRPESLIGAKLKYGKYNWTILNWEDGVVYALCDKLIATLPYDTETNIWTKSALEVWLETEGLKIITQRGASDDS